MGGHVCEKRREGPWFLFFMSWKGLLVLDWPSEAGGHSAIKH